MGGQKNRRTDKQRNKGGAALNFRVNELFNPSLHLISPVSCPCIQKTALPVGLGERQPHVPHKSYPHARHPFLLLSSANALPLISSLSSPSALFSSPSASIVIAVAPPPLPLHPTMQWRHASRAFFHGPRRSPTTSPAADRMSLPSRPPTTSPGPNHLLCNSPPAMHLSRGPRPRPRRRPLGMPVTNLAARVRASR